MVSRHAGHARERSSPRGSVGVPQRLQDLVVTVPLEELVGSARERGNRALHEPEQVAQAERGPSFGESVLLGDLGGIGVPAPVEPEVLRAARLQPMIGQIHAARQLGHGRAVDHEYLGAPESEPQRGLVPRLRADEERNVLIARIHVS